MNAILLYLDSDKSERQEMVQLAADLVEALTFQHENLLQQHQSIGVVAEPSVCLEIGLSMLGRGEARTVEGGERQKSPLMMFPFVADSEESKTELGLMGGFNDRHDEYGTLDDLAKFGAIEQDEESRGKEWHFQSANEVLARVLQKRTWGNIVIFGSGKFDFENEKLFRHTDAHVTRVRRDDFNSERFHALFERLEPTKNESLYQVQREAVASALQFEELLKRFEIQEKAMGGVSY